MKGNKMKKHSVFLFYLINFFALIFLVISTFSSLQAQTVRSYWIYQHMQDGKIAVSFSKDIRCVDTTFAPYPMTELTWEADTTVVVVCGTQSMTKNAELHANLPAGDYTTWSTYKNGKWNVIFHSLYDGDGDNDVDFIDFSLLGNRANAENWSIDRILKETKCFIQVYNENPEFKWIEEKE